MSVALKNFNNTKQIYTFQCHFYNSVSTVCIVLHRTVLYGNIEHQSTLMYSIVHWPLEPELYTTKL